MLCVVTTAMTTQVKVDTGDVVALIVEGVQVLSAVAKESMYHVPKQSQALKIMKLLAKQWGRIGCSEIVAAARGGGDVTSGVVDGEALTLFVVANGSAASLSQKLALKTVKLQAKAVMGAKMLNGVESVVCGDDGSGGVDEGSEIVAAARGGGDVTSGVVDGEGGVGDTAHVQNLYLLVVPTIYSNPALTLFVVANGSEASLSQKLALKTVKLQAKAVMGAKMLCVVTTAMTTQVKVDTGDVVVLCEALEGHGKAPLVVVLVPIVEALLAQLVVAVLMSFVVDEVALSVVAVKELC
eukprot:jgi/Phyca11/533025/estExt2_fgenesh1_pg.C_PHYCAscaffold_100005